MGENYEFESSKLKKYRKVIFSMAFLGQLLTLYFFTVIGRFDTAESDNILKNYVSLSGLASTICMCILVIYGSIIINRCLVKNYIGEDKLRTYLYPNGRSQLFYDKVMSFCGMFFGVQLLGMSVANILYLLMESVAPILVTSNTALYSIGHFFVTSIATVILTISLIFFSGMAGIYLNSTVATIVTGIILIAVFGNIVAMAFASQLLVTLSSAIFILLITLICIKITGAKIEKDEVLSK
ncbi:hypothetical protein [Terribacillus sp. 7520-G]|uniref:hypothetical protein n=1 Tax=Terribacillus sp. 7520-G TaxID=2025389 RepID=UPI000BA7889E|nr:hypothetical protein [Terribacillus sp. 7520-G]PAD37592.1 hypothetical protein CHH53_15420 [Terribacillus sp. 7520-G]